MKRILTISVLLVAVIFTCSADRRRLLMSRNVSSGAVAQGFMGGNRTNQFVNTAASGTSVTYNNERAGQQMMYSGNINSFHVWVVGTTHIKLKVFRSIGTNVFNFVGDIGTYYLTAGTNYITTGLPYAVKEGDVVSLWNSNASTVIPLAALSGGMRYSTLEQSGSGYTFTTPADYKLNVAAYGDAVRVAFGGDSIITPHPYGFTYGVQGDQYIGSPSNSMTWKLGNEMGYTTPYVNVAYPDKTFDHVDRTQYPLVTNTTATTWFIHCGVNDIGTARPWSDVLTNLNSIRSKWTGSLILSEILPWTGGSDAQALTIRTWNTNLAVWCATSSATLFQIHDDMATNRVSTGQLDDLAVRYDSDTVHLTTAGRTNYARRVKAVLP